MSARAVARLKGGGRSRSRRLQAIRSIALGIAMVVTQASCERTLVFTEQSAFKLGIEVNNDPTTPVEVTAGLKRRVLSVAPPKEPERNDQDGQTQVEGDAVSMLSGFNLGYEPADSPLTGTLEIRSQFASGAAATILATDAGAIAKVVNVTTAFGPDQATDDLIRLLEEKPELEEELRAYLRERGVHVSLTTFLYAEEFSSLRSSALQQLEANP
jgi:hypothetical protein